MLSELARSVGLDPEADLAMPANNRMLVFVAKEQVCSA
jgi:hypothetical protein